MSSSRVSPAFASRQVERGNVCSPVTRLDRVGKTWVLHTETKGTGANMVPLEKVLKEPSEGDKSRAGPRRKPAPSPGRSKAAARPSKPDRPVEATSTPLPPGHVRKKATGEIGKVQAVDSRAGTATVRWLKRGATSTVPLSAITRR
jgi:hypothetical protein